MALYDAEWCLRALKRYANIPPVGVADSLLYERLSESQRYIITLIGSVAPDSLYGAPQPMFTNDNKVFTFGLDPVGNPIMPMGHTGIYRRLDLVPHAPMRAGVDYLPEGFQIRIPENRTIPGPLYWRGVGYVPDIGVSVSMPTVIATQLGIPIATQDGTPLDANGIITILTPPSILPYNARELIVFDACKNYATEYVRNSELADRMALMFDRKWEQWCIAWKTQFRSGGAIQSFTSFNFPYTQYAPWGYYG